MFQFHYQKEYIVGIQFGTCLQTLIHFIIYSSSTQCSISLITSTVQASLLAADSYLGWWILSVSSSFWLNFLLLISAYISSIIGFHNRTRALMNQLDTCPNFRIAELSKSDENSWKSKEILKQQEPDFWLIHFLLQVNASLCPWGTWKITKEQTFLQLILHIFKKLTRFVSNSYGWRKFWNIHALKTETDFSGKPLCGLHNWLSFLFNCWRAHCFWMNVASKDFSFSFVHIVLECIPMEIIQLVILSLRFLYTEVIVWRV